MVREQYYGIPETLPTDLFPRGRGFQWWGLQRWSESRPGITRPGIMPGETFFRTEQFFERRD